MITWRNVDCFTKSREVIEAFDQCKKTVAAADEQRQVRIRNGVEHATRERMRLHVMYGNERQLVLPKQQPGELDALPEARLQTGLHSQCDRVNALPSVVAHLLDAIAHRPYQVLGVKAASQLGLNAAGERVERHLGATKTLVNRPLIELLLGQNSTVRVDHSTCCVIARSLDAKHTNASPLICHATPVR